MEIGVELATRRIERFYMVLEKGLEKQSMSHLDALVKILKVLCMGF